MLYNSKNQVITLNQHQKQICTIAIAALLAGMTKTAEIRARTKILKPLRETKELSDPCGRGTNGMFALDNRARMQ